MELKYRDLLIREKDILHEHEQEIEEMEQRLCRMGRPGLPDMKWLKLRYEYMLLEIRAREANLAMMIDDETCAERIRDLRTRRKGNHGNDHKAESAGGVPEVLRDGAEAVQPEPERAGADGRV